MQPFALSIRMQLESKRMHFRELSQCFIYYTVFRIFPFPLNADLRKVEIQFDIASNCTRFEPRSKLVLPIEHYSGKIEQISK